MSTHGAHKNDKKKEVDIPFFPLLSIKFFYDIINICKNTLGFVGRKKWKGILSNKWYSLTFAVNIPRKFEVY